MGLKIDRDDRVVWVRLDRPEVLNALDTGTMEELVDTLTPLDRDPGVGCFVITGAERAFAAGADIAEMADASAVDMYSRNHLALLDAIRFIRKPIVAAVSRVVPVAYAEIVASIAKIRLARNQLARDPARAEGTLAGLQEDSRRTLENLRELSRGIHPPVLSHHGLVEAVRTQAGLSPIDVHVEVAPQLRDARFPDAVEEAAGPQGE
jgi:hypothetical protein